MSTPDKQADPSERPQTVARNDGGFPRPHWRKMTWLIVIWCVVMAIWIIAGIASSGDSTDCAKEATQYFSQQTCEDAEDTGTGIAVVALWFIWFFGFIALSLIWFMTRPKGRECPACGERVKKGRTNCPKCGHDFAAAARAASPQQA